MEAASTVRIGKIEISKDKNGTKYATVELIRVIDESDRYTHRIKQAIEQMKENPALKSIEISETVLNRNLIFFAGFGVTSPSEQFLGVELRKFRIKRDQVGQREDLLMKFKFTVKLDEAYGWTIKAIGDDVLCVIEDPQPSLSGME